MDLQLGGKRVLITGASKGIGLACAIAFAREGAEPILVARDDAALSAAAQAIGAQTGRQARAHTLDLAQPGAVERLSQEAGDIDILVNNAGAVPGGSLDQVQDERWRAGWELKVHGYIALARHYYPRMRVAGAGVIANIIGMAGSAPRADYICGAAANASLIAFTRALGGDAPRHGVRVFGVNPSRTRTDRVLTLGQSSAPRISLGRRKPLAGNPVGPALRPPDGARGSGRHDRLRRLAARGLPERHRDRPGRRRTVRQPRALRRVPGAARVQAARQPASSAGR